MATRDQNPAPSVALDETALSEIAEVKQKSPMIELGTTGLKRNAGYVDEEFLVHLKGRKAVQVYREMGENDPIVGALLFSIQQLLRGVSWQVVPAGKSKEAQAQAHFVETCMEDMSDSWDDTIQEILSFLQYGWSWHEIVYKRRVGPLEPTGATRSKYTDGLIGWRKIPIRGQETLQRWVFDESGDTKAMIQMAAPDYKTRTLPIERSLLFRFGHRKNNPEGRSILRNSYRPWYYKKRIEESEAVGIERDLAGLPIVKVPAEYLKAKPGSEQYKMVESMKKLVRSVRRNEQEGIVFPTSFDQDSKQPLFNFELLNSGGARQHNTDTIIQRYEQRQLMTVLADFIMVGHSRTGTYNLHVDKTSIFRDALNATADMIADVFNRHAIPRLFAANGWQSDELPKIEASDVDAPDLGQLASFLSATSGMGFSWGPDGDMEKFLRRAAGLPELSDDDMKSRQEMARVDETARFAETQTRAMAARSTLMQTMQQQQMIANGEMPMEQPQQANQGQNGQKPPDRSQQ